MKNLIQRKLDTCDTIVVFGGNNPLVPVNARAAVLYGAIGAVAIALRTHGADQDGGNAEFRSGTTTRQDAADALREEMRPINKMARALPRDEFPGVRELFRMPRSNAYAALVSRAQSFLDAIGPVKATFVERGLPADFDERLAEKLAAIAPAAITRSTGKAVRVGGTAGLLEQAAKGMRAIRELDSILSYQYRNNIPLLAAWKSACHVARDPKTEEEPNGPSVQTSGSPTTLAKAAPRQVPVSGNGHESIPGDVESRVNGSSGRLVG